MRSVAPDRPGSAASQNSWSVVKLKPTAGSLATTTDQTIQTANDSSSAGIEIQRLRRAMARPGLVPELRVLRAASPSISMRPSAPIVLRGSWIGCISGSSGSLSSAVPGASRSMLADREVHPDERDRRRATNSSMKQLVQMPVRSLSTPKAIGSTKPPRPPIMPTRPPTAPTLFGIVDRDVLEDRRLAEAHEEAEHEDDDR